MARRKRVRVSGRTVELLIVPIPSSPDWRIDILMDAKRRDQEEEIKCINNNIVDIPSSSTCSSCVLLLISCNK